jgi:hypothetical protein
MHGRRFTFPVLGAGFDPTNNKQAGYEDISVGVARKLEQAMPLTCFWKARRMPSSEWKSPSKFFACLAQSKKPQTTEPVEMIGPLRLFSAFSPENPTRHLPANL